MTNGVIRGVRDSISDNKVWDGTPEETTIKLEIRCLKSRSSFLLSNFRWICLSFLIGMRLTFPDCKKNKSKQPRNNGYKTRAACLTLYRNNISLTLHKSERGFVVVCINVWVPKKKPPYSVILSSVDISFLELQCVQLLECYCIESSTCWTIKSYSEISRSVQSLK